MNNIEVDELFKSIDLSSKGFITIDDIRDNDLMSEEVKKAKEKKKDCT